jgi:hypothetical protein
MRNIRPPSTRVVCVAEHGDVVADVDVLAYVTCTRLRGHMWHPFVVSQAAPCVAL